MTSGAHFFFRLYFDLEVRLLLREEKNRLNRLVNSLDRHRTPQSTQEERTQNTIIHSSVTP